MILHHEIEMMSKLNNFANGVHARDICILVKQQLKMYAGDLIEYFSSNGVKARDETDLHNLLTEPLTLYFINMLYCSFKKKASNERNFVYDLVKNSQSIVGEMELLKLESKLYNSRMGVYQGELIKKTTI